ncbi:STAS domain-containing protein [Streptomyces fulvorobeus]|uniref:Anti-sigma factor antagonist n=1 Tax=Streptomyces fulvorobeus TaxID=284028 RepID=A0A7Y9HH95_9ACTN|nr:STAS domain-containing protein [Streptomyces fulvorobeus]NYE44540.1 anti-sigma B factor antagonist [Streptomyces fulvorobeus]
MNRLVITPAVVGRDAVLALAGELDMGSETLLARAVREQIEAGCRRIVLDCVGISFCDSRGFSALLEARQQAREAKGALVLAAVPEQLQYVLTLLGADNIFTIASTVEQARLLLAASAADNESGPA